MWAGERLSCTPPATLLSTAAADNDAVVAGGKFLLLFKHCGQRVILLNPTGDMIVSCPYNHLLCMIQGSFMSMHHGGALRCHLAKHVPSLHAIKTLSSPNHRCRCGPPSSSSLSSIAGRHRWPSTCCAHTKPPIRQSLGHRCAFECGILGPTAATHSPCPAALILFLWAAKMVTYLERLCHAPPPPPQFASRKGTARGRRALKKLLNSQYVQVSSTGL